MDASRIYYVYLHCKPDGDPFYVGKGCDTPKCRRSHLFRHRNAHYQNIVNKYGMDNIEVLVFPRASEQEALSCEISWIKLLRSSGYILANICDGGEGASGRKVSEETKEKIRAAQIGKSRPSQSAEVNARRSAALKGRSKPPRTAEHSAKLGAAHRGKKCPPRTAEHCSKLSAARIQFWATQRNGR
jgi:hypothetical protein